MPLSMVSQAREISGKMPIMQLHCISVGGAQEKRSVRQTLAGQSLHQQGRPVSFTAVSVLARLLSLSPLLSLSLVMSV